MAFESVKSSIGFLDCRITAAAKTSPAKHPLPTSSTPATR